ncbi:MAG: hypothetical protein DSY76_00925, partial [Bacteroidetes bacterium]
MQNEENNITTNESPKKHRLRKGILRSLLGVFIFLTIIFLTLQLTVVQTYLANQFANYLSEKTNTEIKLDRLSINGLLSVDLFGLNVIDQEDSLMVNSKQISLDIRLLDLLDDKLTITNIFIDSTYFALREDHRDTVLNLMKIIDYFETSDTSTSQSDIQIIVDRLNIQNAHYVMYLWSATSFDDGGMNYTDLDVKNVNLIINDFHVSGDSLIGNLEHLSALEKCGFELDEFAGDVIVSPREIIIDYFKLRTPKSWAYANFEMHYNEWPDWLEFIDQVRFKTQFDSASIFLDDIKYFAPVMEGMHDSIRFSGLVRGPISNMKLRKGRVFIGKGTHYIGDINLQGLPDIDQSFMLIKAKSIRTNYHDLSNFVLPDNQRLSIPEIVKKLGNINISGRFTGFYNDFVSNARYRTALGQFTTDILLQPHNEKDGVLEYHGRLTTKNFHLGSLLNIKNYGGVSMTAAIDGIGLDKNAEATYNIDIASIFVSKYEYNDVTLKGDIQNQRITAYLESKDGKFNLNVDGYYDYKDTLPAYKAHINVKNARVARLFLLDEDTIGHLSGIIDIDMEGNNLDNVSGLLSIDSLEYLYKDKTFRSDH